MLAAKENCKECPRALLRRLHLGNDDGPGERPEEFGGEGLIEIVARVSGEEDRSELVLKGVEDIAPVYSLYVVSWRLLLAKGRIFAG